MTQYPDQSKLSCDSVGLFDLLAVAESRIAALNHQQDSTGQYWVHLLIEPALLQMGLGKTAQAIAVLEHLRQFYGRPGPFLIVAPLTTLPHWQRELQAWTGMVGDTRLCC